MRAPDSHKGGGDGPGLSRRVVQCRGILIGRSREECRGAACFLIVLVVVGGGSSYNSESVDATLGSDSVSDNSGGGSALGFCGGDGLGLFCSGETGSDSTDGG